MQRMQHGWHVYWLWAVATFVMGWTCGVLSLLLLIYGAQ
jgi:hypothetical protein